MTKTFITFGRVLALFRLTPKGIHWLQRARLQSLVKSILQTALEKTKEDLQWFMETFWPIKTGALIRNAIMFLWRNQWYTLDETALIAIGSDLHYLQYLQTMKRRFGTVHWTNPMTEIIEDDILGNTYDYVGKQLLVNLTKYLRSWNLEWLFGRGRPPTKILLEYDETTPGRKNWERTLYYYGHEKPLEVLV
jgi:hypothetical protein